MIDIISMIALSLFSIILIRKTRRIHQENKKANYLIVGNKPHKTRVIEAFVFFTTYPMMFLWALTSIGLFLNLCIHQQLIVQLIGLVFLFIGIGIYGIAVNELKGNWRLGVNYNGNGELVDTHIYQYSRHPAYLGFIMMFLGITLVYTHWMHITMAFLSIVSLLLLANEEEAYLIFHFKDQYRAYQERTYQLLGKKNKK